MSKVLLDIAIERVVDENVITIVKLAGRLDGATYTLLIRSVQRLVEAGERKLVFDLQHITELGSAGLIALHQAARLIQGDTQLEVGWAALHALEHDLVAGRSLGIKILRPSSAAIETLVISGFAALVEPYASLDAAVKAFRSETILPLQYAC